MARAVTWLAVCLIVVGALMVAYNPLLSRFATMIVDTTPPQPSSANTLLVCYPSFDNPDPNLAATSLPTSSTSPGLLYPGKSCELVLIVYEDNPDVATISIVDQSSGSTIVSSASMRLHSQSSPNIVRYVYSWTVPSSLNKVYAFTVLVKDVAGNSATWTYYGQTSGGVQGYFTINGVKVQSTSDVIVLKTRSLAVEFYATSGASSIQYVHVTIKDQKTGTYVGGFDQYGQPVYMTKASSGDKWTQSITLPYDGKFIITGTVYPIGASSVTLMSLAVSTGAEFPIDPLTVAGVALIAVGAIVFVKTRED
jgi:hypothetical protein